MIYRTSPFERVQLKAIILEQVKATHYDNDERRLAMIIYEYKEVKKRVSRIQLLITVQFIVFIAVMPALLHHFMYEHDNLLGGVLAFASVMYAIYSLVLSSNSNMYEHKMIDAYKELIQEYTDKIRPRKVSGSEPSH